MNPDMRLELSREQTQEQLLDYRQEQLLELLLECRIGGSMQQALLQLLGYIIEDKPDCDMDSALYLLTTQSHGHYLGQMLQYLCYQRCQQSGSAYLKLCLERRGQGATDKPRHPGPRSRTLFRHGLLRLQCAVFPQSSWLRVSKLLAMDVLTEADWDGFNCYSVTDPATTADVYFSTDGAAQVLLCGLREHGIAFAVTQFNGRGQQPPAQWPLIKSKSERRTRRNKQR